MKNLPFENCHVQEVVSVLKQFGTDRQLGLKPAEAAARLERYGTNELPVPKRPSRIIAFLRRFHNGLTYILLAAAVISLFVGNRGDAFVIVFVILVNIAFGFVQELKAEGALQKLKDMVVSEATVVRGGDVLRLPVSQVVPGDLLQLEEGDRIPADARIIELRDARADESSLTGESLAVEKITAAMAENSPLAERRNMLWLGTTLVSGTARAVVVATGGQTAFGQLAQSLGEIKREKPPFVARIDRLGWQLGILFIILAALTAGLAALSGYPTSDLFFFAVALAVSAIPEGLPSVLAVVLAIGVQRMARRNAIVRRLPAVETLGEADVICTDKTGTLTENRMTATEVVTADQLIGVSGEALSTVGEFTVGDRSVVPTEWPDLAMLLKSCVLASRAELRWADDKPQITGDPTEAALVILAAKAGIERRRLEGQYRVLDDLSFSSSRRYRATLVEETDLKGNRQRMVFVVGAWETLAARAGSASAAATLDWETARIRLEEANADMARRSRRVVAVAMQSVPLDTVAVSDAEIRQLHILGLVGMVDPPRAGVAGAISRCREAGVRVIMITGDQRETAIAVAREVGLVGSDFASVDAVSESDLQQVDAARFDHIVSTATVFARVTPETKLRIVDSLRRQGHVVAMTGDGVNDAPALKRAAVGISMGRSGTDVAREVADIILVDDNFVSIVSAIEEGRVVFRNIKRTTAYLFTTNMGEMLTLLTSVAAGLPLPLLPAQILWMNLVTDGFPNVALATETAHPSTLKRPPRSRDANFITRGTLVLALLTSAMMGIVTLLAFSFAFTVDGRLEHARTMAFTVMATCQLWNVFNLRSLTGSLREFGFSGNRYILLSVAVSFGLQVAVVYFPPLAKAFRTVPLSALDWLVALSLSFLIIPLVEAYKWLLRRRVIPLAWI